jgi:methylmalonyl-CoA mutase cobalamin-binding subunit
MMPDQHDPLRSGSEILADRLTGVTLGPSHSKFTCVAYADDVTVIMTCSTDGNHLQDALKKYERATGGKLN